MQEIREILSRHEAGQSIRRIAREVGVARKSVTRYLQEAAQLPEGSVAGEDAARAVGQAVQRRSAAQPSEQWQEVVAHRERIEAWLKADRPLRLVRIHELLARDGLKAGYATLRRYAQRELGWRLTATTVRLPDPPPGQEAQIDFGLMGCVKDPEGRAHKVYALIIVLAFSRNMFVWPTFRQTTEEFCAGLDAAWRFFGGIPKHIILDNAAAAVVKTSPTDPRLNRSFRDYTDARHLFPDTARVRHPRDKAKVENQVPYPRERWFAGEQFPCDLAMLRQSAENWCRDVAGTRLHGTTRQVPREVYESEERATMQPPPSAPFDVPIWSTVKVHPDHHVQVAKALYSVPSRYVGKSLEARCDRKTVRLYLATELIKVHPRVPPGKRVTNVEDFPPGKAAWALRDVDSVVKRGANYGTHVATFLERMLGGPLPWIKLRQGYALLRLCERFEPERVNALCARSLAFDVLDVARIERMLKQAMQFEVDPVNHGKVIPLPSRFARDKVAFATRLSSENGGQP